MEIWHDDNGQVMAVYTHPYTGSVWQAAGFQRAESDQPLTRDYRVTVANGRVVSATVRANPVQPIPSEESLLAAAKQAVLDELLTSRLTAPDAPQAVKDYAARKR